jgi:hypothetical protein
MAWQACLLLIHRKSSRMRTNGRGGPSLWRSRRAGRLLERIQSRLLSLALQYVRSAMGPGSGRDQVEGANRQQQALRELRDGRKPCFLSPILCQSRDALGDRKIRWSDFVGKYETYPVKIRLPLQGSVILSLSFFVCPRPSPGGARGRCYITSPVIPANVNGPRHGIVSA